MDSIVVSHFWNVLMVSLRSARVELTRCGVVERNDMVDVAEPNDELPGDWVEAVVEDENDADLRSGVLLASC